MRDGVFPPSGVFAGSGVWIVSGVCAKLREARAQEHSRPSPNRLILAHLATATRLSSTACDAQMNWRSDERAYSAPFTSLDSATTKWFDRKNAVRRVIRRTV